MRVLAINNDSSPKFGGLTKALKNKIYLDGQKDIEKMLLKKPNTYPGVGQLPNFIFKKLPAENRREAIREILGVFDKIANTIRDYSPQGDGWIMDRSLRYRPIEVNKLLEDILRKYNIITKWDDIDIKYIDQGGKGKVFKLDGLRDPDTEDEYVIKVFHQLKGKEWHPFKSHGCYAEINNGMYWREHEGHDTHRGKFFFANLGSGYIVSKFLDEDVTLPKRVVPEYNYGIKCTDEEKDGPINGYNRIKGYNYDYGGMRVVNRLKNGNKVARKTLKKIKSLDTNEKLSYWNDIYSNYRSTGSELAGIALGIKYMENKNYHIDRCLELKNVTVNRALGYVLKYLDNYEDQLNYFEKLLIASNEKSTKDAETQIILFNEIPLLAKRKEKGTILHDDINASLKEIFPEKIYDYYMISEKYAQPETVEHLASFVHLLPRNKVKQQYIKLTNFINPALQERLLWKLSFLEKDIKDYAIIKLAHKIENEELRERLINIAKSSGPEYYERVFDIIESKKNTIKN